MREPSTNQAHQPFPWRPYAALWLLTLAVVGADAAGLAWGGYALRPQGLAREIQADLLLAGLAALLAGIARLPRYAAAARTLRCDRLADTLAWLLLAKVWIVAACVASYLCAGLAFPLVDASLAALDRALGFDWPAAYGRVRAHPAAHDLLTLAYRSALWQLPGLICLLGLLGKRRALAGYVLTLALASLLMLLASTPFPAASAYLHFNIDDPGTAETVSHFYALRAGTLRAIDLASLQGLVSIPSFHTVLALLFIDAARHWRPAWCVAVPLNILMIASTPTEGGHYLADVAAGMLLAAVAIAAGRRLMQTTGAPPVAAAGAPEQHRAA